MDVSLGLNVTAGRSGRGPKGSLCWPEEGLGRGAGGVLKTQDVLPGKLHGEKDKSWDHEEGMQIVY